MKAPGCDFCVATTPGVWLYSCRDFEMPLAGLGVTHMSTGAWLACDECSALIEADDYAELAVRSAFATGSVRTEVVDRVAELHKRFKAHRTGERRPFG